MNPNQYQGSWPQTYPQGRLQGPSHHHNTSESSASGPSITYAAPSGYVHSGYQAALQSNANRMQQSNFWPQPNHRIQTGVNPTSSSLSRPPRLGSGGPIRCSYPGCEYSGYPKSVELHRMDRHLIFPPGYKPPSSTPDGEIGPNMTIPGTGISLNTPGAIEAWIAERRKNWPTAERIAEKQKRKAEAIERGQLEHTSNKRPRADGPQAFEGSQRGRGRGRGARGGYRGRGRGFGGGDTRRVPAAESIPQPALSRRPRPGGELAPVLSDGDDSSDIGSGSDVDPTRDIVSSKIPPQGHDEVEFEAEQPPNQPTETTVKAYKKKPPRQPPPITYNPLVDRPSFLKKLLQPEIKHTVSNLSQAIRFIVDNDMFRGVELKPGEVDNVLIREVQSSKEGDSNHSKPWP